MNKYVRDRILIPIGIPVAVLVGTGFVIVNLSRVLLAVNKDLSVVIAIAVATAILLGAAFAASPKRRRRSRAPLGLLVVFALPVGTAGGVAARHGERKAEARPTKPVPTASPSGTPGPVADVTVQLTAKNVSWDKRIIEMPSGKSIDVKVL